MPDFKDAISKAVMGMTPGEAIDSGICINCTKEITGFRNEISRREYQISGLCQSCQDSVFGGD